MPPGNYFPICEAAFRQGMRKDAETGSVILRKPILGPARANALLHYPDEALPAAICNRLRIIRLRLEYSGHVWSYDFVEGRTHDGRKFRLLSTIDEARPECLALSVARRLSSEDVHSDGGNLAKAGPRAAESS